MKPFFASTRGKTASPALTTCAAARSASPLSRAVWAASEAGTVARIDPRTDEVTAVPVGGAPRALDGGAGAVWVSVSELTRAPPGA